MVSRSLGYEDASRIYTFVAVFGRGPEWISQAYREGLAITYSEILDSRVSIAKLLVKDVNLVEYYSFTYLASLVDSSRERLSRRILVTNRTLSTSIPTTSGGTARAVNIRVFFWLMRE